MANRSCLYTTDHLPVSPEWMQRKDLRGVGVTRLVLGGGANILHHGFSAAEA